MTTYRQSGVGYNEPIAYTGQPEVFGSDTITPGITEGRSLLVIVNSSDTLGVGVTDARLTNAVTVATTDVLTAGFVEVVSPIQAVVTASDAPGVGVADATSGAVAVALVASDAPTLSITDVNSDLGQIQYKTAEDDLTIAVNDSGYGAAILADSPAVYWKLDEEKVGGVNQIHDSSGSGNHGAYQGAGTKNSVFGPTDSLAMETTVAEGFATGPTDLGTTFVNGLSISLWMKVPTDAATTWMGYAYHPLGKGNAGQPDSTFNLYVFGMASGSLSVGLYGSPGGTWNGLTGNIPLAADGQWHHYTFTFDPATRIGRRYVDGVLHGTYNPGSGPLYLPVNGNALVGSAWQNHGLDELAIFDSVLTATQVAAHYAARSAQVVALEAQFTKQDDLIIQVGDSTGTPASPDVDVYVASTDNIGLVVTDSTVSAIASFSASDVALVGVTDAFATVAGVLASTDTITTGITDATIDYSAFVTTSDSLVLVATEDHISTDVTVATTDTVSPGILEEPVLINGDLTGLDPLHIAVEEAFGIFGSLDRSDTLTVGITDAWVSPVVTTVLTTDTLAVSIFDAFSIINTFLDRTDILAAGITEGFNILGVLVVNDQFFISVDSDAPDSILFSSRADNPTISLVESGFLFRNIYEGPPPDLIIAATMGEATVVTRRIDIYEADGITPYLLDCPFTGGSVSVDQARDERRTADLTLYNENNALRQNPDGGFWYDKIIKVYRGVRTSSVFWERQLGEFMIDNISAPHFPYTVSVTCRDYTKKLLLSKFRQATEFPQNQPIEEVIRAIAVNGGIPADQMDLPLTGKSTGRAFPFDRGVERWAAIKEIAHAYGYEVFFTNDGILTMQEMQDPLTDVPVMDFKTGPDGNIVSYEKRTSDARMYNQIVVTGESTDTLPVWAEAVNTDPSHPTNVSRLGYRTYFFTSAFIETQAQAQETANRFLKVHALEQFEVGIDSIVMPWLDVGNIVTFTDPNPGVGDPDRFLFSSFDIPLELGPMSSTAKRVTVVA